MSSRIQLFIIPTTYLKVWKPRDRDNFGVRLANSLLTCVCASCNWIGMFLCQSIIRVENVCRPRPLLWSIEEKPNSLKPRRCSCLKTFGSLAPTRLAPLNSFLARPKPVSQLVGLAQNSQFLSPVKCLKVNKAAYMANVFNIWTSTKLFFLVFWLKDR